MPDLKRSCGNYLCGSVDTDNVVGLITTARLFNLAKLEAKCVEYMADNIDEVLYAIFVRF